MDLKKTAEILWAGAMTCFIFGSTCALMAIGADGHSFLTLPEIGLKLSGWLPGAGLLGGALTLAKASGIAEVTRQKQKEEDQAIWIDDIGSDLPRPSFRNDKVTSNFTAQAKTASTVTDNRPQMNSNARTLNNT